MLRSRNKYRDRLEIIADILEVVRGGSKKTHIMFQANLSYRLLCQYLYEVMEAGLVRLEATSSKNYFLTEKGKLFLELFSKYSRQKKEVEDSVRCIAGKKEALKKIL